MYVFLVSELGDVIELPHAPHQTHQVAAAGQAAPEDGQVQPVQRNDLDPLDVVFHAGRPLAGLHLVCDSREGNGHRSG